MPIQTSSPVTAIVLVGPPASGKSTLRAIFEDYGAVGCDVAQFHDIYGTVDAEYNNAVVSAIEDAADSELNVCCIEGPISSDEVSFITDVVDSTLVIRVLVPTDTERRSRYIDREISFQSGETVPDNARAVARQYAQLRETGERPYPEHDVSILNTDDVSTSELTSRVAHIIAAVTDRSRDDLSSPRQETESSVETLVSDTYATQPGVVGDGDTDSPDDTELPDDAFEYATRTANPLTDIVDTVDSTLADSETNERN